MAADAPHSREQVVATPPPPPKAWPRMVLTCLWPGCKYVEAYRPSPPAYCPAHVSMLMPVEVEMTRPTAKVEGTAAS